MNITRTFLLLPVLVIIGSPLFADTVSLLNRTPELGTVSKVSTNELVLERSSGPITIPASQVVTISFTGEPTGLATARQAFIEQKYADVLRHLNSIDPTHAISKFASQEAAYYRAVANMKLAQESGKNITEAGKGLIDFTSQNIDSVHVFKVNEMTASLLMATRKYDDARKFYEKLGREAPWVDYKMRAQVNLGMIDLAENKTADAQKKFQAVFSAVQSGAGAAEQQQKQFAQIGLARCLVKEKKYDEAVKQLEDLAATANAEDLNLQANIYLAIGNANEEAGRNKDALLAYLHIDILYSTSRTEHIEALKHIVSLWRKLQREDRAQETEARLKSIYGI